jgi:hypothetical protein
VPCAIGVLPAKGLGGVLTNLVCIGEPAKITSAGGVVGYEEAHLACRAGRQGHRALRRLRPQGSRSQKADGNGGKNDSPVDCCFVLTLNLINMSHRHHVRAGRDICFTAQKSAFAATGMP